MYKTLRLHAYPSMRNDILDIQSNHNYATRSFHLRVPYCRIIKCKQMISYQGVKNWNLLPETLREKSSLSSFKSACKRHHLGNY